MSAEYCQCGHLRFGHDRSAGQCDDCECQRVVLACDMCEDRRMVSVAPVIGSARYRQQGGLGHVLHHPLPTVRT